MKQYAITTASGAELPVIADHFSVSSAGVAMFYRRKPGQAPADRNDEQVAAVPLGDGHVRLDEETAVLDCVVSDLTEEMEDELKEALGLAELGETAKLRLAITIIK